MEKVSQGFAGPPSGALSQKEKTSLYEETMQRLRQLFVVTRDPIARMSTIAALLKSAFPHFIWVGFYQIHGGELVVGPYQGAPACLVLERHRGVCWAGVDRAETVVVPDVHAFPGHIVCDERAASEVVIPVIDASGWICGVLDVDSGDFDAFDDVDTRHLREIVALVHGRREATPPG